ncbi:glycosyltransferase [Butyrivibrio sp. MB2005]|uniref:glycosyltransferase n=1 Tax=Butyrivibrio sp. MB2005 TaxID=1280678 RepID=UPI0004223F5D|nr:glycosyltransferase [Butyrivibrio sp. MB2005]
MRGNLLYDFTYYQTKMGYHGGGEYGNTVLNELLSRSDLENCGLYVLKNLPVYSKLLNRAEERGWRVHAISDLRNLPHILKQYKYDKLYSALPYGNKYNWESVNFPKDVKFIYTIHGVRMMETNLYQKAEQGFFEDGDDTNGNYIFQTNPRVLENGAEMYREILDVTYNRKIITVSDYSKCSIHYYFNDVNPSEIAVFDAPPKQGDKGSDKVVEKRYLEELGITSGGYALMVSAGVYYKNVLRGVMAFDNLFDRDFSQIPEDYRVVVGGVKNPDVFLSRIRNKDRFILLGYVEDIDLEILYKHAHMLLYPTLNEGFGYPPIEAMKYGTICVCSAGTSVSEVCGDMVIYFNPLLIDEICVKILEAFDPEIRKELQKKIRQKLPELQSRQEADLKAMVDYILEDEF